MLLGSDWLFIGLLLRIIVIITFWIVFQIQLHEVSPELNDFEVIYWLNRRHTESLGKLSRQKQALQRERDNLIEESQKLRADKERAEEYIIELETTSAESRQTNTQLKQEIQTRQNDLALQGMDTIIQQN